MYGHDGDLIAIGQVDTFQRAMAVGQRINGLIRQIIHPNQANAPEFRQARQLEDGHVCQMSAVFQRALVLMEVVA